MEQKGNNVINNYKGVMLCSRPNENTLPPIQKPFCGRVYNHEQLGLVPIKKQGSPSKQKKTMTSILRKHKIWLQQFKNRQLQVKQQIEQKNKQQEQKYKKIKQIGQIDRQRARKMKNQYNKTAIKVMNILDQQNIIQTKPAELTKENLRKLDLINQKNIEKGEFVKKSDNESKKQRAMNEQERKQQEQIDGLLDFFDTTQITKFSQDEQVKLILTSLKQKISQLKQQDDWRQREAHRLHQKQQRRKQRQLNNNDQDKKSKISAGSQARSVASEKTQSNWLDMVENIQELRKKKQDNQQWDKYTASQKHSFTNVDEKIAKNLADEVLRNYPHLRGVHSNISIRRLLEAEAARAINEPIIRPVITTIVKDPKPLDSNNLPYLHRNPSI